MSMLIPDDDEPRVKCAFGPGWFPRSWLTPVGMGDPETLVCRKHLKEMAEEFLAELGQEASRTPTRNEEA